MSKTSQIKVLNTKGEEVKDFVVPASLLAQNIKPELVHQVVVGYAANRRAGTAHTKTRAEVSGGGKEPDTAPFVHLCGWVVAWCLVRAIQGIMSKDYQHN